MIATQLLKRFTPIILFSLLILLLWQVLHVDNQKTKPSPLIGQSIPDFSLPNLFAPQQKFHSSLFKGHTSLLTVWASWCYACEAEQETLIKISRQYQTPIYGLNYKDNPKEAKDWLHKHGNPFTAIIQDEDGDLAIDLGVIGTPETYVISPYGKIIYKHVGVITQETWEKVLLPRIQQYQEQHYV